MVFTNVVEFNAVGDGQDLTKRTRGRPVPGVAYKKQSKLSSHRLASSMSNRARLQ
jgi:hypothetical protein